MKQVLSILDAGVQDWDRGTVAEAFFRPLRLFSDAKQSHGSVRISAARLQSPSHSLLVVERVVMVTAVAVAPSESADPLVGQFSLGSFLEASLGRLL